MLKIDRKNQSFTYLDTPSLAEASISERYDLQEFISNSPDVAFREIGQELFLLGKEIEPSEEVQDRIDLLAIDKEGACVVIELKRGNHKLHMLQAISYAAMISQWGSDDLLHLLDDEQQDALTDFLDIDKDEINRKQRVILLAEAYDYALLIGAEWLSEQYGVDITCCRIAVATDSTTNSEYLVCSNVYPAPELSKEAVSRGRKRGGSEKAKWSDWETALGGVTNLAVSTYFQQEIGENQESYLPKRTLWYRLAGKRFWAMTARNKNAYVWQRGRFPDDIEFWQSGVSQPDKIKPVKDDKCLRLILNTADDFRFFNDSAKETLPSRGCRPHTLREEIGEGTEES